MIVEIQITLRSGDDLLIPLMERYCNFNGHVYSLDFYTTQSNEASILALTVSLGLFTDRYPHVFIKRTYYLNHKHF